MARVFCCFVQPNLILPFRYQLFFRDRTGLGIAIVIDAFLTLASHRMRGGKI
jgi:hypothetical protein